MDAKELRIGNWVNFHQFDGAAQIGALTDSSVRMKDLGFGVGYDQISPISLSADLLEKNCGFNRREYISGYIGIEIKTNFYTSVVFKIEPDRSLTYEWKHGGVPLTLNIKYLHKLQNFFYELAGVELAINF